LEADMENYIRYKLIGGKMILKADVVPHLFDCQPDRKRAASTPERSVAFKRQRKQLVEEALCEAKEVNRTELELTTTVIDFDQPNLMCGI
ncbi:hypothetical protein NQ318_007621, partial [Aromia moschata]